ncbi:MAG TPA: protein kinase, partial [Cyanothece sp. UBA12306]|nr:protein kinase [Cyanothece sp. UBA12306]
MGNQIIVDSSGNGDYVSIGEAIENAQAETEILIRQGLYQEAIILNKPLKIVGEGEINNIIIETADSSCILMQTDYAIVRGLTLRCSESVNQNKFSTVDIAQGKLLLEDCDITSSSLCGIFISGSQNNSIIRRCKIHDNLSGIVISNNGLVNIENCDIYANARVGIVILEE